MLSLEFTKKLDTINKVLEIIDNSNIVELKDEIQSYHEKHFSFLGKYFYENNPLENNKAEISEELKKLNPITNRFFKKYYRTMVRANAKLENLLTNVSRVEIEALNIDKLASVSKQIEDFMFNIEDNDNFSVKNISNLNLYIREHYELTSKLRIMQKVYGSLNEEKNLPEKFKEFEITFYTLDQSVEVFSSRILSFKLIYEIFLRLHNISEDETNKLIILKAEKENTEHYKFAGLTYIINDIYFITKEWIKESSDTNSSSKQVMNLINTRNLENRVKTLIEKNQINNDTGEKYFGVIKKSLKNLQVEKCMSIEIYTENLNISSKPKVEKEETINDVFDVKPAKIEPVMPKTYNEVMVENKESDTLKKIENSLLMNSTLPPLDEQSVEDLFRRGITLMSIKRYNEAIEYFDKALSIKPNFAEAYNYKASAYIQAGRFNDAIKFTDQAIALKNNYRDAYLNKGTALFSLGRHNEALLQYSKTVEIDNKYAEGFFNLGSCFMMIEGKKKDAIKAFTKALEIAPNYAAAFYNRACAYVAEKDIDDCIKDLESAIKLDNNFINVLKLDNDFNPIQDYPKFISLIS